MRDETNLQSLSGLALIGLVLLVSSGTIALAGVGAWTTDGPHGDPLAGYVSVLSDFRVEGLLYAGSADGLFKSLDNGSTWLPAGLAGQVATPLATGPDGILLASAGDPASSLYKSADGGDNWIAVPDGEFTYKAAVDPLDSMTLYRVSAPPMTEVPPELTPSSLLRSFDGGLTWAVIDPPDKSVGFFGDLVVDPSASGTLYVIAPVLEIGNDPNKPPIVVERVFKSVDWGSAWARLGAPGGGRQLAIDPMDPSTLYLVTETSDTSAYKSTDGGTSFSEITALDLSISEIRVDPLRSSRVYALAGDTAVASSDGGNHWWPMPIVPYPLHLTIDATGEFLHVAAGYAVFDYEVPERAPVEPSRRNPTTRVLPARPAE